MLGNRNHPPKDPALPNINANPNIYRTIRGILTIPTTENTTTIAAKMNTPILLLLKSVWK